ncbi:HAMP domain-containing histidine kinase [Pseudomonas sp. MAP12]|uniref:histidine kinase n=1 Tax=Geopseudomonas aromaticivorans TaxID=2849492 RepID=A0ABS6MZZ1_9GAMM|nr:HAMP domain-containing sensor histidine kinase [Pseudomonas aromaticivorans]MBV2134376.1 HAMP domain-containing histidine kinase [Pseudomonas aromaticivorans]
MAFRQSLSQRIVTAFVLMSLLVAGAFAVGTVVTVHVVEKRLLSAELGRDLDRLLRMENMDEWRLQPQPDQLFYVSDGPVELAMTEDVAGLDEGFHEVFRGPQSFHAMVREVSGRHYVLLQDQSDFEAREDLMYVVVAVGFIFSLLLAAALGWLLARQVMAPVTRLAHQVRHRDQLLALAPPLAPDYAPDEVGQLAGAFDETLNQLREVLNREQMFTSDVSHELRTPLMVLASSCELLLENPALDERARRQVQRIARASSDMRELVQTFLLLARAQSGQASLAQQATLAQVADELVAQWRAPIETKGLRLDYLSDHSLSTLFNAPFLRAVLGNLLRNAWHYTDSGHIRLSLGADGFVVEDSGEGIPEALRESVFEPFVRVNRERGDGLGLGLSLVKRICEHEGWQIRLQSAQPHGCRFEVRLTSV